MCSPTSSITVQTQVLHWVNTSNLTCHLIVRCTRSFFQPIDIWWLCLMWNHDGRTSPLTSSLVFCHQNKPSSSPPRLIGYFNKDLETYFHFLMSRNLPLGLLESEHLLSMFLRRSLNKKEERSGCWRQQSHCIQQAWSTSWLAADGIALHKRSPTFSARHQMSFQVFGLVELSRSHQIYDLNSQANTAAMPHWL